MQDRFDHPWIGKVPKGGNVYSIFLPSGKLWAEEPGGGP